MVCFSLNTEDIVGYFKIEKSQMLIFKIYHWILRIDATDVAELV